MLRGWAERLRRRVTRPLPVWQQRLAGRGLDPFVLRTLSRSPDLETAWFACPRVDWAVEVAIRAPVEPAVLTEGFAHVRHALGVWQVDSSALSGGVQRVEEGMDPGVLLESLGPALLRCVDLAPEVQTKLGLVQNAERWKDRPKMMKFADAYDAAHVEAHRTLTSAFRVGVPAAALRLVLEPRQAHPYR